MTQGGYGSRRRLSPAPGITGAAARWVVLARPASLSRQVPVRRAARPAGAVSPVPLSARLRTGPTSAAGQPGGRAQSRCSAPPRAQDPLGCNSQVSRTPSGRWYERCSTPGRQGRAASRPASRDKGPVLARPQVVRCRLGGPARLRRRCRGVGVVQPVASRHERRLLRQHPTECRAIVADSRDQQERRARSL
jgi:hypothetical protein